MNDLDRDDGIATLERDLRRARTEWDAKAKTAAGFQKGVAHGLAIALSYLTRLEAGRQEAA